MNKKLIMRPNKYYVYFALFIFFLLAFCSEETIIYEDPLLLEIEEFTFLPNTPNKNDEVSMIFYGCEYYQTSSVAIQKKDVEVIKKFNGAMKRPCILVYDTIELGKFHKGTYNVTLKIIDINPFAQDSLFHSETKSLIIQ